MWEDVTAPRVSKGDVEIDIVSSVGVEKDDVWSVVCSGVPVPWLPAMMDTQPAKTI